MALLLVLVGLLMVALVLDSAKDFPQPELSPPHPATSLEEKIAVCFSFFLLHI
jgi:hypothetical protein